MKMKEFDYIIIMFWKVLHMWEGPMETGNENTMPGC